MKSVCPTFLRSKGKAMPVTLSDNEVSDNESSNDEDGNSIAFTATAIVDECTVVEQNPLRGNSLRMQIYKKSTINFTKLLQRML